MDLIVVPVVNALTEDYILVLLTIGVGQAI
jgi:hypothetical protein